MPARLQIRRVTASLPAAAAEAVAREMARAAPAGRDLLLATLEVPTAMGPGAGPGLAPAPWTIAGTRAAYATSPAGARIEQVGLPLRGGASRGREDVPLAWPGISRRLRVPRAWLGKNACFVTPCVFAIDDRHAPVGDGPVASVFAALARAVGAPAFGDPAGLGARIAARIFAHVAVIVDATWTVLRREATRPMVSPLALRHATARCVALEAPCAIADGRAVSIDEIDTWLARRLGLCGVVGLPAITVHGDAIDPPPVSVTSGHLALADREIPALLPRDGPAPRSLFVTSPLDALDRAWDTWTAARSV